MTHLGLFEGIGGFSLAAEWMDWETFAWCEINPFCRRVLKYYWPNAKAHKDIKKTDFTVYRGLIDIVTAGFPCQPYSVAGKRKGKDDNRHLWPQTIRAIKEIQPSWVVGENVYGIINWSRGMVFNEVQADLEAEGYKVWAYVLPACAVNAPHRRDRVWFIAHKEFPSDSTSIIKRKQANKINAQPEVRRTRIEFGCTSDGGITPNANVFNGRGRAKGKKGKEINNSDKRTPSNSDSQQRRKGRVYTAQQEETERYTGPRHTREGWNTWKDFPTQSPLRSRNDEFSCGLVGITISKWETEGIKALGNAIVPEVAYQIFKAIEAYEKLNLVAIE